jgi:SAM-dependent methyltransferase
VNHERRLSFGAVAELYDSARPPYPPAMVDDVLEYAAAGVGGAVTTALEIGAGTGKATVAFAARGLAVTALEPSAEMAAVAARNCAGFPDVRIELAELESARLEPGAFELAFSGQAWHWITPELRYGLARAPLVDGGALAVFWNQADWDATELAGPLREAYRRSGAVLVDHGPMYPGERSPLDLGDDWGDQIASSGCFAEATTRLHRWSCGYTAAEYVSLLRTHSDHIVLADGDRSRLLDEVAATIERHGGTLELAYATLLCVARAAG